MTQPATKRLVTEAQIADRNSPAGQSISTAVANTATPAKFVSTAAMTTWLGALANVRAGTGDAKLVFLGDSTTAGVNSGGIRDNSFPSHVSRRLAANLAPTIKGFDLPPNPASMDTRYTIGTGWAISGGVGPGSYGVYGGAGASGTYRFTPASGRNTDAVDLWLLHGAGKGTVQPKVKGLSWGSAIDSSTGSGWQKHTVSGFNAANDNYFDATGPTGGDVYALWGEAYLTTQRTVRVGNWGVPGSSTGTWTDTTESLTALTAYDPDLTVVMLGINDANPTAPVSAATYEARLDSIVAYAKIAGDVVLMTPFQPSVASGRQAAVETYNAKVYAVAAARDCPVIDLYGRFGVHGADPEALWADDLHLTSKGYARAARLVVDGLMAL